MLCLDKIRACRIQHCELGYVLNVKEISYNISKVVLWDISNWNDRLLSHRQTSKAKKNTMTSLVNYVY